MSLAFPPTEYFNGIYYNPAFYIHDVGTLTLAYINANFLKSVGVALSTATLTTFTGAVNINGVLTLTAGISLTGGLIVDNLTVNGTSAIIGQATFTLAPILPAGFQFLTNTSQTISGTKTFSSVITTNGINDNLSITSPTLTASTVCNAPYFNATNATLNSSLYGLSVGGILSTNLISNSSATLPITLYCGSVSLPSAINTNSGLQIGWNASLGTGETDLINLAQGAPANGGGFNFSTLSNTLTNSNLAFLGKYGNFGLTLFSGCGRLRINDRNGGAFYWSQSEEGATMQMSNSGISTSTTFNNGDASGVLINALTLNSSSVSPNINLNPLSTTTFNVSHPTTTLGDNISTNTTQYATVGYVNSTGGTSILSLNNTWTGTNAFTKPYISISSVTAPINIGSGTGNTGNVIIGNSACLSTVTANSGNICIGGGVSQSLNLSTGTGNICVGNGSATAITTGSNNLCYGNGCGTTISTASNNTIIGAGAWSTGTSNFSNCTCIGQNCDPPTANNQIIFGTINETVYINGASNLNNSLLYGTTVCSGSIFQVNNQIKRFHTTYTTGVVNTITDPLPYMILFTPIAGMSFTMPAPSATNAGQTFIIRRLATGGNQNIVFSISGGTASWLLLNSGTAVGSITISTVWQFTYYSTGTQYIAIA